MQLIPKNWADFQHYKDRAPPWIKLHKDLLDDRTFQRLPVASRALAPMLWLLASESKDGAFDGSVEELAFRLRASEDEIDSGLTPLIDKGFFLPASKPLAKRKRAATPETEGEADTEGETDLSAAKLPPCQHAKVLNLFVRHLPELPQPKLELWGGQPAKDLTARWKWVLTAKRGNGERYATNEDEALDWFERFFAYVGKSDFLSGRNGQWNGCDVRWLVKADNFAKVVQGNYENKAAA